MRIPLFDQKHQHQPLRTEIEAAFQRILDRGSFILGAEGEALEAAIARRYGAGFAIAVSSGTDALLVALMALGVGHGDEVIVPAYSFFATAGVVSRLGARPIFVDIDPATYNIDPALIEAALTPRTRAIVPVHLFGQCAEMRPICEVATRHRLFVVEDAAQAIGARCADGQIAATVGDCGCLSFYPTKNLGGMGDGGMVLTRDSQIGHRIRALRGHGAYERYRHDLVGGNFRLDELQAAVLNVKLPYLESWNEQRRNSARSYGALFAAAGLVGEQGVRLPHEAHPEVAGSHIYNQYVIEVPRRDDLRAWLTQRGVSTEVYYPVPLHLQPCFAHLGYRAGQLPRAEAAAARSLALPVYPGLSEEMRAYVVAQVAAFYKQIGQRV